MKFSETYFYKFLKAMFSDDKNVSSKRVAATIALLSFETIAFVNLFYGNIVSSDIITAHILIILGGYGMSTAENVFENFKNNFKPPSENQ